MTAFRTPRNMDQARVMLEQFAELAGRAEAIEAKRNAAIAAVNQAADADAGPVIEAQDAIRAALETYWAKAGAELTAGKRKSIELGGCMIGTKLSPTTLANLHAGGFDGQAERMHKLDWARPFVKLSYSLDKAAIRKALNGPDGPRLKGRGFRLVPGSDQFFVERVAQGGVMASE